MLGHSPGSLCSKGNIPPPPYYFSSLDIWSNFCSSSRGQSEPDNRDMCYGMLPLARAFFWGGETQEFSHHTLRTSSSLPSSIFLSFPETTSPSKHLAKAAGRLPFLLVWEPFCMGSRSSAFVQGTGWSQHQGLKITSVLGASSTQVTTQRAMLCRKQLHSRASPRACSSTQRTQTRGVPTSSHPRCLSSLYHVSGSFQGEGVF